jgi:hypothetical protein
MSALEKRAKPILLPLLSAETVTLTPRQLRTLGTWAFKMMLTIELCHSREATVLDAEYRDFYRDRRPPRHAYVWATALREPLYTSVYERQSLALPLHNQPVDYPTAYCATLAIENLLLQVFAGVFGEPLVLSGIHPEVERALIEL